MTKRFNQGFTLIELLVVIAIIGILSSVVLASLNTARGKGADAAVKSNLNNMRAQAELYYDNNNGSYTNLCTADASVVKALTAAMTAGGATSVVTSGAAGNATTVSCYAAGQTYVIQAPLKTTGAGYWCVDNSGSSKTEAAATLANPTACI